jgi:hypothetical protein
MYSQQFSLIFTAQKNDSTTVVVAPTAYAAFEAKKSMVKKSTISWDACQMLSRWFLVRLILPP